MTNDPREIIRQECGDTYGTPEQRMEAMRRLEEECDMHPQQARMWLEDETE